MLCKWQYYLYVEHVSVVELPNCNNAGRQEGVICPSKHRSAEWGDVATGIKLISMRAGISTAEPSASHPTLLPPHFSCESRGHYHWRRKRKKDSHQHRGSGQAVTPGACQILLHNMYTLLGLCSSRLEADFHMVMPFRVLSEQQSGACVGE